MITAVDTNIVIDILEPDPTFGPDSKSALKQCLNQGAVVACDVVWAEAATAYGDITKDLVNAMNLMDIQFSAMSLEASMVAAACWHSYREDAKTGKRIVADFLIGGHALAQCDRLLTRNRGFYKNYFNALIVIRP